MRKLVFMLILSASASAATFAQQEELRPFRIGANAGFPVTNAKFGLLAGFELKYFVIPQLGIGIKGDFDLVLRNFEYGTLYKNSIALHFLLPVSITADLYFTGKTAVRPFIGAGYGIYHIEATRLFMFFPIGGMDEATTNNFGAMFRAGLNIGRHLNVALTYHNAGRDGLHNNAKFYGVSLGVLAGVGKKDSNRQP
jgi:opacity protein-like surface antigen